MKDLLFLIPIVFCFFTGILIAVNSYVAIRTTCIIREIKKQKRKVRFSDFVIVTITSIVALMLTTLMFITPEFTAHNINAILFFEVWYSLFLFQLTQQTMRSAIEVKHFKQEQNNGTIISFLDRKIS